MPLPSSPRVPEDSGAGVRVAAAELGLPRHRGYIRPPSPSQALQAHLPTPLALPVHSPELQLLSPPQIIATAAALLFLNSGEPSIPSPSNLHLEHPPAPLDPPSSSPPPFAGRSAVPNLAGAAFRRGRCPAWLRASWRARCPWTDAPPRPEASGAPRSAGDGRSRSARRRRCALPCSPLFCREQKEEGDDQRAGPAWQRHSPPSVFLKVMGVRLGPAQEQQQQQRWDSAQSSPASTVLINLFPEKKICQGPIGE